MLIVLFCASAQAWETLSNTSGSEIRWQVMPIEFGINPDNEAGLDEAGVEASIRRAAMAWAEVPATDIEFDVSMTDIAVTDHDGQATVYFRDDWQLDPELLALTSNWSTSEGQIISFDVAINTHDHEWSLDGESGLTDLQNTMAHEFGHVLGLGHELQETEATMWSSSPRGETIKRDLHALDELGAIYLYPTEEPEETTPLGCSSAPVVGFWLLGLMLLRRRSDPLEGGSTCC
ncbi:MAG TPA: matrixin family metalloprotease [Myxococcota bacterium]|nr:matrixin family metalloprotease [Myxococcota bacterium]